jgi:hypothetical protein
MVDVIESNSDYTVGTMPGAVFHLWRGNGMSSGVRVITDALAKVHAEDSGLPMVLFGVLQPDVPIPDDESRRNMVDAMRNTVGLRASVMVFEGHGFKASAIRAIVSGFGLLARVPYPHDVCASVPLGARWLTRWCPEHDPERLIAAVEALRAES